MLFHPKSQRSVKNFHNVSEPPFISGPDDQLVLVTLPPPEFHLFEGCVNKIVVELNKRFSIEASSEDKLYEWMEENLYIKGRAILSPIYISYQLNYFPKQSSICFLMYHSVQISF